MIKDRNVIKYPTIQEAITGKIIICLDKNANISFTLSSHTVITYVFSNKFAITMLLPFVMKLLHS